MRRLLVGLAMLSLVGCSNGNTADTAQKAASREIPVTSKSPEAIAHFQQGRMLVENQRAAEAAADLSVRPVAPHETGHVADVVLEGFGRSTSSGWRRITSMNE